MKNTLILDNKNALMLKIILLALPLTVILVYLDKVSLFIILAVLGLAIFYVCFRQYTWIVLILAIPTLTLGRIINIPITADWVYEARLAELILFFISAIFILDIYFNNKLKQLKVNFLFILLLALTLVSMASFFYIISFRYYIFGLKAVVFSFLAYWLALNLINSKERIKYFLYSLIASALILSVQLFVKFYQTGWSSKFFFERNTIFVPIGPVATSAAILAFLTPIILAFYLSKQDDKKYRALIFAGFIISLLAVFLTLGKAAIFSLLVGLLFLIKNIKNKIPFVLMVLWFVVLVYFAFNPYLSGLFERVKTTFVDVNTEFRIKEYKTGWELISEHPLIGVGAGQQLAHFKEKLDLESPQQVNNYFLQPFIDLGVIGFSLVVLIFISVFKKAWQAAKNNPKNILVLGFTAALIVAGLNGLAEVSFYALPYAIIFWLTMGAFENIFKRQPTNQQISHKSTNKHL
ncbi:MAG: O-antigen ligase family protein [Patescibacteria group bacterium]|nr:O-antigen ligase family protein [Patescibacteria group bacterium]